MRWWKCSKHINVWVFYLCFPVTADTFLVEGNKQEHQLSNLKPSTSYSVALYATKGPLTSGTVITNLQTRTCSFYSAGVSTASSTVTQWVPLSPRSRRVSPGCSVSFTAKRKNIHVNYEFSDIVLDQGRWLLTASEVVRMSQMQQIRFSPGIHEVQYKE